jgi:hypothetical protein
MSTIEPTPRRGRPSSRPPWRWASLPPEDPRRQEYDRWFAHRYRWHFRRERVRRIAQAIFKWPARIIGAVVLAGYALVIAGAWAGTCIGVYVGLRALLGGVL